MRLTQEQVLTNLKNNYDECSQASCSFWVTSLWTKETVAELQIAAKVFWKLIKTFLFVVLTVLTALLYYPTLGAIKMWNLLVETVNPISTILSVLEVSTDKFTETEYKFDTKIVKEIEKQQKDSTETSFNTAKPIFPPFVYFAASRIKSFLNTPIGELMKTDLIESNNQSNTNDESSV